MRNPWRVEPLQRVSTVEALTGSIRREVLSGALPAGAQLRELELSDRYGVARQSVRSALQALVHAGLLRHEQNRGVFVPRFSPGDVEDIHLLRAAIETEAITAVVARGVTLGPIEAALERLELLPDDAGWDDAVAADLALHTAIVSGLESPRAMRTYEGLLGEERLLLAQVEAHYPRRLVLGPIHRGIVEAIRKGDAVRACAVLRAHLEESRDEVLRAVAEGTATN
jgi:DNA-binding GntR family transcriptional regulator